MPSILIIQCFVCRCGGSLTVSWSRWAGLRSERMRRQDTPRAEYVMPAAAMWPARRTFENDPRHLHFVDWIVDTG